MNSGGGTEIQCLKVIDNECTLLLIRAETTEGPSRGAPGHEIGGVCVGRPGSDNLR